MIADALAFLRGELSQYVLDNQNTADSSNALTAADIMLGNVAALENDQEGRLKDKVVISMVNIEEESTLKNGAHHLRNPLSGGIEYFQRPVFLNLYLLFTATLPDGASSDDYERALRRLSLVIEFFQSKKVFTIQNSPQSIYDNSEDEAVREELRLLPELYTLTFEQINHLWGSLGGKQVPFAMYKVRLVKVQGRYTLDAPVIEEAKGDARELVAPHIPPFEPT
jgi:hypothetical protein